MQKVKQQKKKNEREKTYDTHTERINYTVALTHGYGLFQDVLSLEFQVAYSTTFHGLHKP